MTYRPAYQEAWIATGFREKDSKGMLIPSKRLIEGPLFPFFIKADFQTYEGFRDFSDWVGINGFTYLDDPQWNVSRELDRIEEGKLKEIPDSYLRKFYDRIRDKLVDEQTAMRLFHSVSMGRYINEKKPSRALVEKVVDRISNALGRHLSCIEVTLRTEPRGFMGLFRNKVLGWEFSCKTLPARCYLEMIDLISDKKKVQECGYCGEVFIPSRKNEEFCNRFAPGYRQPGKERTCKQVGPQKRFFLGKNRNERAWMKEKKKFQNRLYYLEKKGRKDEHKKVMAEFQRWKKRTEFQN